MFKTVEQRSKQRKHPIILIGSLYWRIIIPHIIGVRKFPYIKQPIRIFERSADVCENLWSDSLTDPPKFYFQTTRERWNLFPQAVMEKHTHNETQMNHHEIYTYAIASLKLTWHLKITPWKRRLLLETIMFREYVSFGEGMYVYVCKMDVCIYMYIEI